MITRSKILSKLQHEKTEYAVRDITFLTCSIFVETHKISMKEIFDVNFSFLFWFIRPDGLAVMYRSGEEYEHFAQKVGDAYLEDIEYAKKIANTLIEMSDFINNFIRENNSLEKFILNRDVICEKYMDFFAYHQAVYWPAEYLLKLESRNKNDEKLNKVINILDKAYKYNEEVVPNVEKYFSDLGVDKYSVREIKEDILYDNKDVSGERSVMLLDGEIYILLPKEAQEINEYIVDDYKKYVSDLKNIKGSVANGGKVQGIVRLIIDLKKLGECQEGDILVTTQTRPQYNTAIKKVKAIVTDEGGLLCHASMLAREFNIPCIVGTKIATQVLKDGDEVEVDAEKGIVKILKK